MIHAKLVVFSAVHCNNGSKPPLLRRLFDYPRANEMILTLFIEQRFEPSSIPSMVASMNSFFWAFFLHSTAYFFLDQR